MIGTKLFRNYFAHDEYKTDYLDLNVSYTKLLSVVKLRLSKVRALETSVADPALANAPPRKVERRMREYRGAEGVEVSGVWGNFLILNIKLSNSSAF